MMRFDLDQHVDRRRCANARCGQQIGHEFVLQVSSAHLRWFCGVHCVTEGLEAHHQAVYAQSNADLARDPTGTADVAWRRAADVAIKTLADSGRPFTADDLVALVGPPVAPSGKAMGPRFSHAAQAGIIRPVGFRESSRVSGRILRSWTGGPS